MEEIPLSENIYEVIDGWVNRDSVVASTEDEDYDVFVLGTPNEIFESGQIVSVKEKKFKVKQFINYKNGFYEHEVDSVE